VIIRKIEEDELDQAVRRLGRTFGRNAPECVVREAFRRRCLECAAEGGEILGYIAHYGSNPVVVEYLMVRWKYRRQGVGARILDHMKWWYPGLKVTTAHRYRAWKFYEKQGFVETARTETARILEWKYPGESSKST